MKWVMSIGILMLSGSNALAWEGETTGATDAPRFEIYGRHPGGLEISNARSGAMCMEDNEPTHVCIETYTVQITGDSICEWSEDVDYPCTWYGYEFDLSGVQEDAVITCDVANSIQTIFGPKTDRVTGSNTAQYFIDIEAGQDHLFHPAYHTYGPVSQKTFVVTIHACNLDGVPVYQASWRAYYEPE